MHKRERVLAAITLVCGVFFIINQFVCAGKTSEHTAAADTQARLQRQKTALTAIQAAEASKRDMVRIATRQQPLVTYEKWGRDPFSGALRLMKVDSLADSISFRLTGIANDGKQRLALIDDAIVAQGDRTDKFEVVRILTDRVLLRVSGQLLTLHLDKEKNRNHAQPGN